MAYYNKLFLRKNARARIKKLLHKTFDYFQMLKNDKKKI
jgi:hypothetical protein